MSHRDKILVRGDGNIIVYGVHNHFQLDLPQKLRSKLAPDEYTYTVGQINKLMNEQMNTNFTCFVIGCFFCCCTVGMSLCPSLVLNVMTKRKIRQILEKENKRIYYSLGLKWSLVKERFGSATEYCLQIEFITKPELIVPD